MALEEDAYNALWVPSATQGCFLWCRLSFGGNRQPTQTDSRRWMRWCCEPRRGEIQSLTVRQIVPLVTLCPFNFSACWLIAKEHCLSQREAKLACLAGYSSAKAPFNELVLISPSSTWLWCLFARFGWLTAVQEAQKSAHALRVRTARSC